MVLQDEQLGMDKVVEDGQLTEVNEYVYDTTSRFPFLMGERNSIINMVTIVGWPSEGPMRAPTTGTQVYYGQKANLADTFWILGVNG